MKYSFEIKEKAIGKQRPRYSSKTGRMYTPTATRSGYIFKGWYTAATGGTKIGYTTMPASDTEIYAQIHLKQK